MNLNSIGDERSHAILDKKSRTIKAKKIEKLAGIEGDFFEKNMLEVGTGSGCIAEYFSQLGYGEAGTYAIDVVDERQVKEGFQFQKVNDTYLPFEDEKFDFIISNHVIEHVGELKEQVNHLKEIYRCLDKNGVFYFAVPNRWRIVEPHYRLPFLSWMPSILADLYMRITGNGKYYDCRPLSRRECRRMLHDQGLYISDVTLGAISIVGELEYTNVISRYVTALPKWVWRPFLFIIPTLIFVCRKTP